MSPEIARAAMAFMQRVELRGAEVQAWMEVVAALKQIAAPEEPKEDDEQT